MKKLLLTLLAALALWPAAAAEAVWQTDLPKALAQAKAEKKLVFLDFTGSDWCEPCQMLVTNIFSQPEFVTYAATNLVLVEVDFPLKRPQTDAVKTANLALAKQFNVDGYPTLIALKADGAEIWRNAGDPLAGPGDLIKKLAGAKAAPRE